MSPGGGLSRAFFDRPAVEVAPDLLGLELQVGPAAVRIVEVEAYEPDDPASHSFIGPRPRTRAMFGPPGHLYVYRSYGIHWCANVVCGPVGTGAAVLVRAGEPLRGLAQMAARRHPVAAPRLLCSGPGRLCAALGIDASHDGSDLIGQARPDASAAGGVRLVEPASGATTAGPSAASVVQTTRIGISKAADRPWRWFEGGNPHVSRPAPRRAGAGAAR